MIDVVIVLMDCLCMQICARYHMRERVVLCVCIVAMTRCVDIVMKLAFANVLILGVSGHQIVIHDYEHNARDAVTKNEL